MEVLRGGDVTSQELTDEEIARKRTAILDRRMQVIGRAADVRVSIHSGDAVTRYYVVDDVVVVVRLVGSTTMLSRRSTIPTDVPWNYDAAVVGRDKDGELHEVGQARFRLYTIFNVRQAIKCHPALQFDQDLVVPMLDHHLPTT